MSVKGGRMVWFCSDPHFGHEGILEKCRPQFKTVREMDEHIVEKWNSVVGVHDLVYCLGDFAWKAKEARAYRERLNGTVRLIVGNHDDIPSLAAQGIFQRMYLWKSFPELGFHATHVPQLRRSLRGATVNVHGHVHGKTEGLARWHIDVSMESIDYTPLSAYQLKIMASRVSE